MIRPVSREFFYLSQVALGALFLAGAWLIKRPRNPESFFKVRESDLKRDSSSSDDLARARMKRRGEKSPPLRLEGIRIDGAPHEILGVRPDASAKEVQTAYRDLMKRYHPDRVGLPGSRPWKDAQSIAGAINRAKESMLKKRRP